MTYLLWTFYVIMGLLVNLLCRIIAGGRVNIEDMLVILLWPLLIVWAFSLAIYCYIKAKYETHH